jgi:hypothetical protein
MLHDIPRRIWFHWMQGLDAMPPVVRHCLHSWRGRNKDWEVIVLDERNVWDYVDRQDLSVPQLLGSSPQVYANAIRLMLLARHGGVWADATTWCSVPLTHWMLALPGMFFAFSDPAPDRMLSNWFLAALPGSYLPARWAMAYAEIFREYGPMRAFPRAMSQEILSRSRSAEVFLDPFLLKNLNGYPYPMCHYVFGHLYRIDPQFKAQWDACKRISAHPSHVAQSLDLRSLMDGVKWTRLREASPLVHKLDWRIDPIPLGSVLQGVLEGRSDFEDAAERLRQGV